MSRKGLRHYSYTDEGVAVLDPKSLRADPKFRRYIRRLRRKQIGRGNG